MINLNGILNPFSSINIAAFYLRYYAFIDAIIYLILFLGVAQIAFLKIYKDSKREGKAIAVAIALCLTISMVVLEMNTGFYLGQLQPIALIVFLLIISTLLFNMFQGLFEKKAVSGAITYLIIYGLLTVPFGALNDWINTNAPFLASILVLGAVASLIYLIIELFSLFGGGSPSTTGPQGPAGNPGKDGRNGADGKDAPSLTKAAPTEQQKNANNPSPSVQILEPNRSANKKYTPSQPIQLVFRANNIPKYKFLVQVKNLNSADNPINIAGGQKDDPNVNITDLRAGFPFPQGRYRIIVRILDFETQAQLTDKEGKEVLDYTDITTIDDQITSPANPQSPDKPSDDSYLEIVQPANKTYESGTIIPIIFNAIGPDYPKGAKCSAKVFIRSSDPKNNISGGEHTFTCPRGEIILPAMEMLPDGDYKVIVITRKEKYLHKAEREFSIATKSKGKKEKKKTESQKEDKNASALEKYEHPNYPQIAIDGEKYTSLKNIDFDSGLHKIRILNSNEEEFTWILQRSDNLLFRKILQNPTGGVIGPNGYEEIEFLCSKNRVESNHDLVIKFISNKTKKSIVFSLVKIRYPLRYDRIPPERRLKEGYKDHRLAAKEILPESRMLEGKSFDVQIKIDTKDLEGIDVIQLPYDNTKHIIEFRNKGSKSVKCTLTNSEGFFEFTQEMVKRDSSHINDTETYVFDIAPKTALIGSYQASKYSKIKRLLSKKPDVVFEVELENEAGKIRKVFSCKTGKVI